MNRHSSMPVRLFFFCLGAFLCALGVCISVASNLGVSPISSVSYVYSTAFDIDLGYCVIACHCFFLCLQALFMGRGFKITSLLQLFGAFLFGYLVIFAQICTFWVPPPANYLLQWIYAIIGIFLVGLGILVYLSVELFTLPAEGVLAALNFRFGMKVSTAKLVLDCICVAITLISAVILLDNFAGVGLGTLACAVGTGPSMKLIRRCTGDLFAVS